MGERMRTHPQAMPENLRVSLPSFCVLEICESIPEGRLSCEARTGSRRVKVLKRFATQLGCATTFRTYVHVLHIACPRLVVIQLSLNSFVASGDRREQLSSATA